MNHVVTVNRDLASNELMTPACEKKKTDWGKPVSLVIFSQESHFINLYLGRVIIETAAQGENSIGRVGINRAIR